MIHGTLLKF